VNNVPECQFIQVEMKQQVLCLRINRQEVYNALHKQSKGELQYMIEWANAQGDSFRAIVIGAIGKAFCTGQDLNDRTSTAGSEGRVDLGNTLNTEWNPLVKAIHDSRIPVIAAVQGVTAGAGISVALACDLIVAAPGIKFVSGFAKIGLCPDAGSTKSLSTLLGKKRAYEFFVFNQPLMSEELQSMGVINKLVSDPWQTALEMAQLLTQMAPLSVQLIKKNIQQASNKDWHEMLLVEVEAQRRLGHSQDYQEGVKAFFEKRPPRFAGK
jgi:2-(1,2-epoxy-1,2-dihydrophenyl)acetyl-CoA isomerase